MEKKETILVLPRAFSVCAFYTFIHEQLLPLHKNPFKVVKSRLIDLQKILLSNIYC